MTQALNFLDRLFDEGILLATGVNGLYGRGAKFEEVIERFDKIVTEIAREDESEVIRFPPAMSRADFEKSGYLESFPHLAGTIHSFDGSSTDYKKLLSKVETGEDWTQFQRATDVVLTPAACYPLYPVVARRGRLPREGSMFDLCTYCFRHEPSEDPARLQLFRQREFVCFGHTSQVLKFRETWMRRGQDLMTALGLPVQIDVANDIFFGRTGQLMADQQRQKRLKFELLIPIDNKDKPTACMSFNYHEDHFGSLFGIETHNGEAARTACVGFGLERIALALFRYHGTDPQSWPPAVRERLGY
jgi:seryl-tRNA synthetase